MSASSVVKGSHSGQWEGGRGSHSGEGRRMNSPGSLPGLAGVCVSLLNVVGANGGPYRRLGSSGKCKKGLGPEWVHWGGGGSEKLEVGGLPHLPEE